MRGIVFNRYYRLEIHSLMVGIFGPSCVLLPLYLLSDLPPLPPFPDYINVQSGKLKSLYGERNRLQEPSLELSSQATKAGGQVRQPYAYLVPSPHSGT